MRVSCKKYVHEAVKQVMLLCCGVQERIKQERQLGEEAATKRLTEQHQEEVRNLIAEHRRQVDALQRNDDDDFGQYTAAAHSLQPSVAARAAARYIVTTSPTRVCGNGWCD